MADDRCDLLCPDLRKAEALRASVCPTVRRASSPTAPAGELMADLHRLP